MSGVRTRTIARLRALATVGVASAACHGSGYGVVDPMPLPSCFDSPQPTATASIVARPASAASDAAEAEAEGTRFLEVVVAYTQTDVKVGAAAAFDDATGASLDVVERARTASGFRCVVRVPKELAEVRVTAPTECRAGSGRIMLVARLGGDAVTVEVR